MLQYELGSQHGLRAAHHRFERVLRRGIWRQMGEPPQYPVDVLTKRE